MSDFMKEATGWATMAIPGAQTPEQQKKLFDAMPPAELADTWRALQQVGLRDKTEGTRATFHYFDSLPHQEPERALAVILEVLKAETNPNMLSYLAAGPLEDLITLDTIDMIESEAGKNERFRWLLGGVWYDTAPDELKARLDAIIQGQHW